MLTGSFAYDIVVSARWPGSGRRLASWGAALMVLGYGLSCVNCLTPPNGYTGGGLSALLVEPPSCPPTRPINIWTMNQQAGSVSYLTFSAGFSWPSTPRSSG